MLTISKRKRSKRPIKIPNLKDLETRKQEKRVRYRDEDAVKDKKTRVGV
jgi:hypothetical protein